MHVHLTLTSSNQGFAVVVLEMGKAEAFLSNGYHTDIADLYANSKPPRIHGQIRQALLALGSEVIHLRLQLLAKWR